ncbi:conserved hypothetical protein [Burkholderia ambifaria MC40-6]|jgi:hypothetical protein|uniref:SMODS and SLOG-associating 2TM effector domain-containing protein n=1 Tax=Burkholderia ambifaria (strain MC40-6) TaxID=398577 RepID=B1YXU4_BURA4|nr:SLATT domain-containing protein [Burkholderia ambifaria]ACB65644.1 conserved hypothetical protein [Burkholderia ambifaria MC40-6]
MTSGATLNFPPAFQKSREALTNRIWFTRKARIQAEKRLLQNDFHSQLMLQIFTAYILVLSIYMLKFHAGGISDDAANVTLLVVSVLLFGRTPAVNSRNFKGRAEAFKIMYVKLQLLLDNLADLDWANSIEEAQHAYAEVQQEYARIIADGENHSEIDDAVARWGITQSSRPLSVLETVSVLFYFGRRWAVWVGGYVVPPVFFVLYYLYRK